MKLAKPREIVEGGEEYLVRARQMLAELRAFCEKTGMQTASRQYNFNGITAFVRVSPEGSDLIYLSGDTLPNNRLFNWPNATAVRGFELKAIKPPPAKPVPDNEKITGVRLSALNQRLTFAVDEASADVIDNPYGQAFSRAKHILHFEMLAKYDRWLLRQWMEQTLLNVLVDRKEGDLNELASPPPRPETFGINKQEDFDAATIAVRLAYQASLAYWRINLPIVFNDCMMSDPDAQGNCYLLLGYFRTKKPVTHPDYNPLDNLIFRGVSVPYSTLKASVDGLSFDLSSWSFITTAAQKSSVKLVTTYERPPAARTYPPLNSNPPLLEGHRNDSLEHIVSSPFNVTYLRTEVWTHLNQTSFGPSSPRPFRHETEVKYFLDKHTLSSAGDVVITPLDFSSISGATSYSNVMTHIAPLNQTITMSPVNCAMVIYTGSEFVRVGNFAFAGMSHVIVNGSGTVSGGAYTLTTSIPLTSIQSPHNYSAEQYISEYNLLRSDSTILIGNEISNFSNVFTSSRFSSGVSNRPEEAGYITPNYNIDDSPDIFNRVNTIEGTTFSLSGDFLISNTAKLSKTRESGLPIRGADGSVSGVQTQGGVFWYRDGPTGVCLFRRIPQEVGVPTRQEDCDRYRKVYQKEEGFKVGQAEYVPLDTLLARIMSKTMIMANNFASPALIPWLDDTVVGIII